MLITNKYNLPEAFVKAIQNSRHNADKCLSATTLLKGTKEIILENRHFDEITVDASEEVWSVFGTATHSVLEHQEDEAFKEESFSVDVLDYKVTGKVDRYDMKHETIEDWKTASVWKVIFHDFEDWKRQGLIYTWLLRQSGLNVRHIRFIENYKPRLFAREFLQFGIPAAQRQPRIEHRPHHRLLSFGYGGRHEDGSASCP